MTEPNPRNPIGPSMQSHPFSSTGNDDSRARERNTKPTDPLVEGFIQLLEGFLSGTSENSGVRLSERIFGSCQITRLWPIDIPNGDDHDQEGTLHYHVIFLPLGRMSGWTTIGLRRVLAGKLRWNMEGNEIDLSADMYSSDRVVEFTNMWARTLRSICFSFYDNWQRSSDYPNPPNMQEFVQMIQGTSTQPSSVPEHDEDDSWTTFFLKHGPSGSKACVIFGSVVDREPYTYAVARLKEFLRETVPDDYKSYLEVCRDYLESLRNDFL